MNRVLLLGMFASTAFLNAEESASSFKVTVVSRAEMEVQGQKQKIDANTEIRYSWERSGQEKTLRWDAVTIKMNVDGTEQTTVSANRAKVVNIRQGKTVEIPFESAPEGLKAMLQDSFAVPVCKVEVDEHGKELKRTIVAGPGAKALLEQGMISNALLFHPPFLPNQEEWQANSEVSMGNNSHAKGKLTYRKVPGGKGVQVVKVSGMLSNDNFQQPGHPQIIFRARYLVRGEQTYDPKQQDWISGRLTIEMSVRGADDDRPIGSAEGTMILTFEKLTGRR